MVEATVEGQLVQAGPDSPEKGCCPACGGAVSKRKRRRMDGSVAYFYRHDNGQGDNCSLRYTPISAER